MQNVHTDKTRNFALIGHSGDGKTTLGESIIHVAGVTKIAGRVDDDSSALNYLPEEQKGHTAARVSRGRRQGRNRKNVARRTGRGNARDRIRERARSPRS
ncbi:MAG: hypothetical protein JRG94_24460 [Deltaproteobacteria bacterium]|nr:hypothetical protein [Deltaproteobacteria bacterium]